MSDGAFDSRILRARRRFGHSRGLLLVGLQHELASLAGREQVHREVDFGNLRRSFCQMTFSGTAT